MKSEEQATEATHAEQVGAAATPHAPTTPPPHAQHSSPHAPPQPSPSAPSDSSPHARQTTRPLVQTTLAHSPTKTPQPRSVSTKKTRRARREPLSHERRVLLMTLAAGAPAVVASLALLVAGDYTPKVFWTLLTLVACFWLGFSFAVQARVVRPLQTVSNLLAALREGDYSFRARGGRGLDALSEVVREINSLGETMREHRLGALEATALLRTVMSEIDVAVFAFDPGGRLRLVNRAGERLLARGAERATGRTAEELGLADCLRVSDDEASHTLAKSFPGDGGASRRWGVRRSSFRERGVAHQLLVVADLSRPLREEELKAWQRIVRVLGHELNNSLAHDPQIGRAHV